MRPLSIKLKSFKGFRAGLGLEEVSLDFTSLPEGLIAIVGGNGMGKTTILDCIQPYRLMPYKLRDSKEWSPGAFSFYDQCYGRDALKEFVFELSGNQYKSVVFIDAERRKQKAYLYLMNAEGAWLPYNDAIKDGNVGVYDQIIEELVGSPSLFFSSVFRSQDARKLSSYPRSEILGIICELLHVDHIKEQGEKAAKVAAALGAMVGDLNRQKAPILALLDTRDEIESRRGQAADTVGQHESALEVLKKEMANTEQQIRELELSNAAQTLTQKRVEELRMRLGSLQSDIQQQQEVMASGAAEHDEEIFRLDLSTAQVAAELQRDTEALESESWQEQDAARAELGAITAKKDAVEAILARVDEIAQANNRVASLEAVLTGDRKQLEGLRVTQGILDRSIAALVSSSENIDAGIRQEQDASRQDSESLAAAEEREKADTRSDLDDIAAKRQALETVLAQADEIGQAVSGEKELSTKLLADQARLEEMRSRGNTLRVSLAEIASVGNEIQAAELRLEDLHRLADGLKGLDCHEDGSGTVNKTCKLLASAVEAERQIPDAEKGLQILLAKQSEADELLRQLTELTGKGKELAAITQAAEGELEAVRAVALLVGDLANASKRTEELAEQESTLRTRLEQRLAEIAGKLQAGATRAQARLAELAAQKADAETKLAEAREQLSQNLQSCDFFATQIVETEEDLAETRKVAILSVELASATSRLAELNEQEASVETRARQRLAETAKKVEDLSSRTQERQKTLAGQKQETVRKYEAAKQQLEKKLDSLIKESATLGEDVRKLEATLNGDVEREVAALNEVVADKRGEITFAEKALKDLHAALGNLKGQLDDMSKKEASLSLLDVEIAKINDEMINWVLLAKACSNDGIVALELDDAGPAVADEANKLLRACYGTRFSVRLETQGTKAGGGLKEIFDITVFDAERGEEKSIRDMSGGEVTYIEDAISRSFCLYNLHKSGRKYGTMFSDEKDGSLDADRKHEFLAIKRQALATGSHDREFFITQTPELYEKADARIMLEPGRVSIG
jgi:exonuclease SbcC